MLNHKREFKYNFGGLEVTLETGRMAKQSDGAVLVSAGGTQVLVTAVSSRELKEGQDFFPLMVDYKEKFYSAGKFLGGFNKREGRPSNAEILLMRMVDRPLRPLFPEGYMYETIIMANVFSYDPAVDPEVLAGIGASAALVISDIPFLTPMAFCKVGRIDGKYRLNPSKEDFKKSDLELVVAASEEALLMVEGESKEISESDMLGAIHYAHQEIKGLCKFIKNMQKEVGKTKRPFTALLSNQTLMNKLKSELESEAVKALSINGKSERNQAIFELKQKLKELMSQNPSSYGLEESANFSAKANLSIDELLYFIMRRDILEKGKRIGGRKLNEIRKIETEVNLLKKVHGSSLFTRGETQVLGAVTLGGKEGEQLVDVVSGLSYEKFYLHYTFPPFSVGEAKGYRGVGRREIGHGNLAERAIRMVLPSEEKCPYTIRVACEVLESNGSSSMGSVCAGSMALMDAGVPLKAPVAGVAMGLIKEGEKYAVLTDILGDEDALGDMDFKVAGSRQGITAIQMDIKIAGLSEEILTDAMEKARVGRLHILGEMEKSISLNRAEYKEGVPRISFTKIAPDKIGALIGPSGKNIKMLQETYAVTLSVEEDGRVMICGVDKEKMDQVVDLIDLQINGPTIGKDYPGVVVTIKEYGAFVDIAPNVSGLVHVSEFADERVQDVNQYVSEGETILVKVLEVDRFGKIKLSAKAAKPLTKKQ